MYILPIFSWLVVIWIAKVFLFSLPYKFTMHPDTQHIFGTIGAWLQDILTSASGGWFIHYGSYVVGGFELITSIILLVPALLWAAKKLKLLSCYPPRNLLHALGGALASLVMAGAVFFHLFTPLGIEVIHEGKSDGGSLFYAAVSILILGTVLSIANYRDYLNALRTGHC